MRASFRHILCPPNIDHISAGLWTYVGLQVYQSHICYPFRLSVCLVSMNCPVTIVFIENRNPDLCYLTKALSMNHFIKIAEGFDFFLTLWAMVFNIE